MARIRSIKPEFWTSEQVAMCSPTARLLFIGLWSFCDDGGVHPASIKRLKMEVLPADAIDDEAMGKLIGELVRADLVREFNVNGERFWHVTGWIRHQRIDKPTIRHPRPPANSTSDRRDLDESSPNARRDVVESSPTEWSGVDGSGIGNGVEQEKKSPKLRFSDYDKGLPEDSPKDHSDKPETKAGTSPKAKPLSCAELLYLAYPRKVGKADALRAINVALKAETYETLSEAVQAFAASPKASSQFCPHPATWFKHERWKDDRNEWQRADSGGRGNARSHGPVIGPGQTYDPNAAVTGL